MPIWECRARVEEYCARCTNLAEIHAGLAFPQRVLTERGNLLTYLGAAALWQRFIGSGSAPAAFNNANAHIGVGDGAALTTPAMTDLQGTSTERQPMNSGFPSHTDGTAQANDTIRFQADFGAGVAEFDWREYGVFNDDTAGVMLNRRAVSFGVKPAGTIWVFTVTLRLYGNEEGAVDVPVGETPFVFPTGPGGIVTCACGPGTGGGGGVLANVFAQYVVAENNGASDVALGVKGRIPVRQPGNIRITDVLADPMAAGTDEIIWNVSKWTLLGTTLLLTAGAVGVPVGTVTGLEVPVANGDVLEFEVTDCTNVHRSTISLHVEDRTDLIKQILWIDRSATVVVVGDRGQRIIRSAGLITGWDLLSDPSGDIAWEVYQNGTLIISPALVGGETAAGTGLAIPVSSGDILEAHIVGTPVDTLRTTLSLTLEP